MPVPANNSLTFHRGAAWGNIITFTQTGSGLPVDLTGLAPFVMEIRQRAGAPLLLSLTYAAIDLVNGRIQFSATAYQTLELPEPNFPGKPLSLRYGIRDALNNPYAEGIAFIEPFTAAPA